MNPRPQLIAAVGLLLALALWLIGVFTPWPLANPGAVGGGASKGGGAPTQLNPTSTDRLAEPEDSAASPIPGSLALTAKGRIRLKPGQSAVMGYWEMGPDMNGLALVTPSLQADGNILLQTQLVSLSDQTARDIEASDLLPDLFNFENFSALDPEAINTLRQSLRGTKNADVLAAPAISSRPGAAAEIQLGQAGSGSLNLKLQADPLPQEDGGGFDLQLQLQRRH
jgi:hypothetical protein